MIASPQAVSRYTHELPGNSSADVYEIGSGDRSIVFLPGHEQTPEDRIEFLAQLALQAPGTRVIAPFTPGTGESSRLQSGEDQIARVDTLLRTLQIRDDPSVCLLGESAGGVIAVQTAAGRVATRAVSVVGPVFNPTDQTALGLALATDEFFANTAAMTKDFMSGSLGSLWTHGSNIFFRSINPARLPNALEADRQIRRLPLEPRLKLFAAGRGTAVFGDLDSAVPFPVDAEYAKYASMTDGGHRLLETDPARRAAHILKLIASMAHKPAVKSVRTHVRKPATLVA